MKFSVRETKFNALELIVYCINNDIKTVLYFKNYNDLNWAVDQLIGA